LKKITKMTKFNIIASVTIGIIMGVALCVGNTHYNSVSYSVSQKENPRCDIPQRLPQWNELVLRLWGSNIIPDDTFKKNFPITGERGSKILKAQGYEDLNQLTNCLIKNFKIRKK